MVLMGYDASVFNSIQSSSNWKAHFGHPNPNMIGLINTTYTVAGIVTGWFLSGPLVSLLEILRDTYLLTLSQRRRTI